ncbi:hemicentin-2 isoform X3 [Nelusetta ayraudi]|uniref:hemicentin-2 isoform X3 n=1 Tax=Nelusetta ayraudi TaxID=303726 RepID=UPI003F72DE6F
MWLLKVFSAICFAAFCAAQNSGDAPHPVPSVSLLTPWHDVFPSEKVEFQCSVSINNSYEYTFTWSRDGHNILPSNSGDGSLLTVTVGALDSGSYTCKAHHTATGHQTASGNSEMLTVHQIPEPELITVVPWAGYFKEESVQLQCLFESRDWAFVWYRNGVQLVMDEVMTLDKEDPFLNISSAAKEHQGNYSCGLTLESRGLRSRRSNIVRIEVYDQFPKLTLHKDPAFDLMFVGELVNFNCSINVPAEMEYLWYREGNIFSPEGSTVSVPLVAGSGGKYSCQATRGNTEVTSEKILQVVIDQKPKPSLTQQPDDNKVYTGETVSLTCNVQLSTGWQYVWFKDGQPLQVKHSSHIITAANGSHSGVYKCMAIRNQTKYTTEYSHERVLKILEIPVPALRPLTQWLDVFPTEHVNLSCAIQGSSDWRYEWEKDGRPLSPSQVVSFDSDKSVLSISGAAAPHGGQYGCSAVLKGRSVTSGASGKLMLKVYDQKPKPSLTQQPDDNKVYTGETVSLTCNVQLSTGWQYVWFKDGQPLQVKHSSHIITAADGSHSGVYKCMAIRNQTAYTTEYSHERVLKILEIPVPALRPLTQWLDVFPTEHVNLSCAIQGSSDWRYEWEKDGRPLSPSQVVSFDSDKSVLSISGAAASHGGQYGCSAVLKGRAVNGGKSQKQNLLVYGQKPKPSLTQQPDDNKVYTGETVSLTCNVQLSTGWQYVWFKDGQPLQVKHSSHIITAANGSHSGVYKCMAIRNQTAYTTEYSHERVLKILEIPVPALRPLTQWLDVFPTEHVNLRCAIQGSSDWRYEWEKDGRPLSPSQMVSFDSDKSVLSISGAAASHGGQYGCSAVLKGRSVTSGASGKLTLKVYDTQPRVTILKIPDHDEIYTEDLISLSCHVNISSGWKFQWFKENLPLAESASDHTVASAVTGNSGLYQCKVKRGSGILFESVSPLAKLDVKERPMAYVSLLTGWSEVFSTDSLVLQCDVELRDEWNYTWYKDDHEINGSYSKRHVVTPQNDPEQSLHKCRGVSSKRPLYSKQSDSFKTRNLLLKRRVLLAISGCIVFGITITILGCIVLRACRKPAKDEYKPDENDLFLPMNHLKDGEDAPCPLVQYITNAALNTSKEGDNNDLICSETTPLPITSQDDQDLEPESQPATETNGGLASFK